MKWLSVLLVLAVGCGSGVGQSGAAADTFAVCSNSSLGSDVTPLQFCSFLCSAERFVMSVAFSPCEVTSEAGTCTATGFSGGCCVCRE